MESTRDGSASPLALVLASFFGTGFFPIAPATFATFILYLLLGFLGGWGLKPAPVLLAAIIVAVIGIGVWASRHGERAWGEDAGRIVIDEVAGGLIAVWAFPLTPTVLGLGFVLFRVMDIVKPPPAYQVQSLPKGWGVMADDLLAGVYAQIILRILWLLHVI